MQTFPNFRSCSQAHIKSPELIKFPGINDFPENAFPCCREAGTPLYLRDVAVTENPSLVAGMCCIENLFAGNTKCLCIGITIELYNGCNKLQNSKRA